jgi:hypothetical protein
VASNKNAIVAGDGSVSHGDGSMTASGGFWDGDARLATVGQLNTSNAADRAYAAQVAALSTQTIFRVAVSNAVRQLAGSGLAWSGGQLTASGGSTAYKRAKLFATNDWTTTYGTPLPILCPLSTNSLVAGIRGWDTHQFAERTGNRMALKFNVAGAGRYRVHAQIQCTDIADTKMLAFRSSYITSARAVTNNIGFMRSTQSGGGSLEAALTFDVDVIATNDLVQFKAWTSDDDGGVEAVVDFSDYAGTWVEVEELR